jgi:hypothetical protein
MPTQIATPNPAPLAPAREGVSAFPEFTELPSYRVSRFIDGVAERLRESRAQGLDDATTLATIRNERLALAAALKDETLHRVFADAYQKEGSAAFPAAPVSATAAREYTDDILKHRINDANALAAFTITPLFLEAVMKKLDGPATARDLSLPMEKIEEMVERFSQASSLYGMDAKIHDQMSMGGHVIGHQALVKIYGPPGVLQPALQAALAKQLPNDSPQAIAEMARDWLEMRALSARQTVETLQEGGIVYNAVMARHPLVETLQPPTVQLSDAAHEGIAQTKTDLLMDRLG